MYSYRSIIRKFKRINDMDSMEEFAEEYFTFTLSGYYCNCVEDFSLDDDEYYNINIRRTCRNCGGEGRYDYHGEIRYGKFGTESVNCHCCYNGKEHLKATLSVYCDGNIRLYYKIGGFEV